MNKYFSANFKNQSSINFLDISLNLLSSSDYYVMIINNDKDDIYYSFQINPAYDTYQIPFNKIFKYDIKLLSFDGNTVKLLQHSIFDIKNHRFKIHLKSDDKNEIEIWKQYIKFFEITYSNKMPIDVTDTIEISRNIYDSYLIGSHVPLRVDNSSLTVIKTIFDVI